MSRFGDLAKYGEELTVNGKLKLHRNDDFLSTIRRVQNSSDHFFNPLLSCLTSLPPQYGVANKLDDLMAVVSAGERASQVTFRESVYALTTGNSSKSNYARSGVVLLVQYFAPRDPLRRKDIDAALAKNLANPAISEVCFVNEIEFDFSGFPNAFKIRQFVISKRLTFKDAFIFANDYLAGRTVILGNVQLINRNPFLIPFLFLKQFAANADIYFDHTLFRLGEPDNLNLHAKGMVLSLLKWVDRGTEGLSLPLRTDSQDAWIFQPPLSLEMAMKADFALGLDTAYLSRKKPNLVRYFLPGLPRCDNRIAFLLNEAKYTVINPAFAVRAIEIDSSQRRNSLYGNIKFTFQFLL